MSFSTKDEPLLSPSSPTDYVPIGTATTSRKSYKTAILYIALTVGVAIASFFAGTLVPGNSNDDYVEDAVVWTSGQCEDCLNTNQPDIPRYQYEIANHPVKLSGHKLPKGVIVAPQKLGGGVSAVDMHTGRTLASLWYSNYGDYGAIPHHIIAFPSKDPYKGFEFLNSCQGGKNTHLYNIPNIDPNPPAATNIYRLRYDGETLLIAENVSDTTGLGLGVHTTINPATAEQYAVSDGQKDIFAIFDRRTTRVEAAFLYSWKGNTGVLATNWIKGGTLTVKRIYSDAKTGKFDYLGTKGNKIDVELAPMAEGELEEGNIPGPDQLGLVAADGFVYHPSGKWGVEIVRMLGGGVIHDLTATDFAPFMYFSFNKDTKDAVPFTQIDKDTWSVKIDYVGSPGHELAFDPTGHYLMMMNNLRENSVGLIDSSNPDPRKWRRLGHIADPLWKGMYPNPFHIGFGHGHQASEGKAYFVVLQPKPAKSNLMIVDLKKQKIIKEIQGIARDMQSIVTSMDGKYVFIITAGFQRFESGLFVLDAVEDKPLGFLPMPGGHHDLALVPHSVADMIYTRAISM